LVIDRLAARLGAKSALVSENESLSYRELAARAHQYGRWAVAEEIGPGDVVALFMANCPEYMAIWLGITRTRAVVSLINTNLTGESLLHAIKTARPKHLIVGAELVDSIITLLPRLPLNIQCWIHGERSHALPRVDDAVQRHESDSIGGSECPSPSIADPALYIYTSGTTGLPKAAKVSHFRIMQWTHWFAGMMDATLDDVIYNCLPMYHSVGGIVAPGAVLVGGGTVVVRKRFSASRFWDDIVESKCTLFQYIGELCRYLVNSPVHPLENHHQLRLCCGNGLGRDVWVRFKERFRVPKILEFYAATEANFSLYNCEEKPGSIGRVPPFIAHRFPVTLVKFDLDKGEPARGQSGLCFRCAPNEIGEAIAKISEDGTNPNGRFEGYVDEGATERKLLRNVFVNGDVWYRSGDLMRQDEKGYYYFVDRVGDTFRWKGENVSATEVAEIISASPGVLWAVVYGVSVPGNDGRAGMAAISVGASFDLAALRAHLCRALPDYARPVFLRMRSALAMTGTFKPEKSELMREGCDPGMVTDEIYFDDKARGKYVLMDHTLYRSIVDGVTRI